MPNKPTNIGTPRSLTSSEATDEVLKERFDAEAVHAGKNAEDLVKQDQERFLKQSEKYFQGQDSAAVLES